VLTSGKEGEIAREEDKGKGCGGNSIVSQVI